MSHLIDMKVPSCKLWIWKNNKPFEISTNELFKNRNIILISIPGAFTPTCTTKHVPSYINELNAFQIRNLNVEVLCMYINDIFVMQAFG